MVVTNPKICSNPALKPPTLDQEVHKRMLQRKTVYFCYLYFEHSPTPLHNRLHRYIFSRAYFRYVSDAAATVASTSIRNLFSRSIPNRWNPDSATPSCRRLASETEVQIVINWLLSRSKHFRNLS